MAAIQTEIWNSMAICIGLWMLVYPESFIRLLCTILLLGVMLKYWKTTLWFFLWYLYYCSGLFILVWAVSPSQEQGQPQQEPVPRRHGVIHTWEYCKLYDNQHIPRSTLKSSFFGRRFVAHIDTGNRACTVITREAFEALYPRGQGAVQKGTQCIRGFQGTTATLPLFEIQYELDGVVGPNKKPLRVSVDAAVTDCQGDHDILISTQDMQIFHDRYGYTIQPVEKFRYFGFAC